MFQSLTSINYSSFYFRVVVDVVVIFFFFFHLISNITFTVIPCDVDVVHELRNYWHRCCNACLLVIFALEKQSQNLGLLGDFLLMVCLLLLLPS